MIKERIKVIAPTKTKLATKPSNSLVPFGVLGILVGAAVVASTAKPSTPEEIFKNKEFRLIDNKLVTGYQNTTIDELIEIYATPETEQAFRKYLNRVHNKLVLDTYFYYEFSAKSYRCNLIPKNYYDLNCYYDLKSKTFLNNNITIGTMDTNIDNLAHRMFFWRKDWSQYVEKSTSVKEFAELLIDLYNSN